MRQQIYIIIGFIVLNINACKEEKLLEKNDSKSNVQTVTSGTSYYNNRTRLFPNNLTGRTSISVKFLEETTENEATRKLVKQYAKEWEAHGNISFEFVGKDADNADIRIALNCKLDQGVGGDSQVGLNKDISQKIPTMRFSSKLKTDDLYFKHVVLHEFGHALGLDHEQDNPRSVVIDRKSNKKMYSKYDRFSIMHYSYDAKSTTDGSIIYTNYKLSDEDKYFIGTLYPFPALEDYTKHNEEKIYTIAGGLDICQNKLTGQIVLYPLREYGYMSKVTNDIYMIRDSKNRKYEFLSSKNFGTSRFTTVNGLTAPILIYRNNELLTNEWIQSSSAYINSNEELYRLDEGLSIYRDPSNDNIILFPRNIDGCLNKNEYHEYDIHDADEKHFHFNSKINLLSYNTDTWKKFVNINLKAPIVIYKNGKLVQRKWLGYDTNNSLLRQKIEKHVYKIDQQLDLFIEKHTENIIIYPCKSTDSNREKRSASTEDNIVLHGGSGEKYLISSQQRFWGRTPTDLSIAFKIYRSGHPISSWISINSIPNIITPSIDHSTEKQKIYTIDGLNIFKVKDTNKIILSGELHSDNKNEYQIRDQSPNRVYAFNLSNNKDFQNKELTTDLIAPIVIYVNKGGSWEHLEQKWIGNE